MDAAEYRELEARLDEALAVFGEREAQFSSAVLSVRDQIAQIRAEVAAMRAGAGRRVPPSESHS